MEVRQGYKLTEVGIIPAMWDVATFGDVFSITAGGDVDPKRSQSFQDETHCYPIYSNALTNYGLYGYCSYADHLAGSLTITARGMVGGANFRDHPYTAIGRVLVLQPKSEVAGVYFAEVINHRVKFANESTGVPQLTAPQISKYRLPFPPLPEQRAIAAVLSDVDALLGGLERLIAKKRDLKQAAMQQLLTGKTRLPGFHGEWEVKQLGELATIQRGASPRPIDSPVWFDEKSSVGWVRISDVTCSGMFLSETRQQLSPIGVNHSRPVASGSLIMSICATVGRPIITKIDVCIHDGFVVFESLKADQRFVYYVLKWLEPTWMRHGQTGSQINLNTGLINGAEIMLAPRAEQTAIAAVLADMDAELSLLTARRDKTRALKQAMMQELLTGRTRLL
ncbi:restriction endonuclease subunit S [Accumulibacter sp.]|uniref:restriction endonuclease subunit S n=1 Tax=Accumulibacter sp. TaxID=2053492 RepID=UPI001AD370B8|nr:restriction endonuclease subunit S [Accumulibacter sp.]MBN8515965.1 restriction endonuclease subunit S [Accumulibacter sp.]MBO3703293.1 restriction endonuclease subunit S [Accumulibacter sp.]